MTRGSGFYGVYEGAWRRLAGRPTDSSMRLVDPLDHGVRGETVPTSELGEVIRVRVTASWRGGTVIVGDPVEDDLVGFYSNDPGLATREWLYGDQHSGWTGRARVDELEEIEEHVTVLREGGEP